MNKLITAALFSIVATSASAKDILYPREACAEIVSSEYSTGGADTSWSQFEILCRSSDGRYTVFVTSWATPAGFFGFGRVAHETQINLVPYDCSELRER